MQCNVYPPHFLEEVQRVLHGFLYTQKLVGTGVAHTKVCRGSCCPYKPLYGQHRGAICSQCRAFCCLIIYDGSMVLNAFDRHALTPQTQKKSDLGSN